MINKSTMMLVRNTLNCFASLGLHGLKHHDAEVEGAGVKYLVWVDMELEYELMCVLRRIFRVFF